MKSAFPIGVFSSLGQTWEFKADGAYNERSVDPDRGPLYTSGTYTVMGNQVVFSESANNYGWGCDGDQRAGTYTWAYDGKALSFKVLDDRCGGREFLLTARPLVKEA
jgi:hypothetical protein